MRREYPDSPIVACGVVVVSCDRVLIVKRAQEPAKDLWALPGGVVHLGERVKEAACREVLEETGLEIEIDKLLGVVDKIDYDESRRIRFHYVIVDYLAHPLSGGVRPGTDASQAKWIGRQDLDGYPLVASSRKMILETLGWDQ